MKTLFKVWWPDRGQEQEDAKNVLAVDAESAASRWADWYDYNSSEYAIVGGELAEVMVLREGETNPVRVRVAGQTTRSYNTKILSEGTTK